MLNDKLWTGWTELSRKNTTWLTQQISGESDITQTLSLNFPEKHNTDKKKAATSLSHRIGLTASFCSLHLRTVRLSQGQQTTSYTYIHTHCMGSLQLQINQACTSLDFGRKSKNAEGTHTGAGGICKLHFETAPGLEPRTFFVSSLPLYNSLAEISSRFKVLHKWFCPL